MDISKFINKKCHNNGDIISLLILDLYKEKKYENILFVRTCTTGKCLDQLLVENKNVNRILYHTDKIRFRSEAHKLTIRLHSNNLEKYLLSLNKTFDLICIDPFHEYELSLHDFRIVSSFLNDSGILISHDCYPWNKQVANPFFIEKEWCGETYIAFVELAYNNPDMFFTILNTDTGIGILSKNQFSLLSNKLDKKKQEHLLFLRKNLGDPYTYFVENSKDIINTIHLNEE